MASEIENSIKEPSFKEKHSISMRIWHWSTFVVIMGSLVTVLFSKTLFNTNTNIPMVQENLQKSNISLSAAQAKSVAHDFNDKLWDWHTYIGYVLAALFLFRLIFEFFQPSEQKLIPAIKKAIRYLRQPGIDKKDTKHYLWVKYLYLVFYFALAVQVGTGLFMAYSDDVPNLQNLRQTISDIHSFFMWVIISYIVIHIIGVVIAELGKKNKGIISDMINGGE